MIDIGRQLLERAGVRPANAKPLMVFHFDNCSVGITCAGQGMLLRPDEAHELALALYDIVLEAYR